MTEKTLTQWRGGGVAGMLLGAMILVLLSTENSLPADAEPKAAALPADLAKVPSDGTALLSVRVADMWSSELLKPTSEKYKKEIDERLMKDLEQLCGLALEQVERITLLELLPPPPLGKPLLFVRTVQPYDLAKVVAAVKNIKVKKYKDEMLYVGDKDWTIYPLDDRSLVYGELPELNSLIDHQQPKEEGNLAAALRLAAEKHSLVLGLNVKLFKDSVGGRLPGEVEPFLPLLQALAATLSVDLAADSRATAVLTFASEKDAKDAIKPAAAGLVLLRAGLDRVLAEVGKDNEATDLAHILKQLQDPLKAMRIEQEGAKLSASIQAKIDAATAGRALLEGVQKMRESAARAQGANNLRQIALAMHNHADSMRGRFPAHAVYSKEGKPLLSWRVLILPYIEQQALYNEFHLNEPWDSEHNKKLLAKMPRTYASPEDEKTLKEHITHYQGFVGKGAFFEGKQGILLPVDIPDGTSNTIMIVEATQAVPWTKPEDIPYDPEKALPKLGLPGAAGFWASLCDGSVRLITPKMSQQTLRLAITRNDGQPLGSDF